MATEEKIRHLAHTIWESEGCPEGKADEHWFKAKQLLKNQEMRKRLVAALVVGLVLIAFFSWVERRFGDFQWWHVYVLVGALIMAVLVRLMPRMGRLLKRVTKHVGFEKESSKAVSGARRQYFMALVPMYFVVSAYLMQSALRSGKLDRAAMILSIAILIFALYLVVASFLRALRENWARITYQLASSLAIIGAVVFAIDLIKATGDLVSLGVKPGYVTIFFSVGLSVILGMMVFHVISLSGEE
jgi:hypothetical protein